ncbi:hypothetical protein ACWDSJ_29815 [Nocardia sp. NPDC003482]
MYAADPVPGGPVHRSIAATNPNPQRTMRTLAESVPSEPTSRSIAAINPNCERAIGTLAGYVASEPTSRPIADTNPIPTGASSVAARPAVGESDSAHLLVAAADTFGERL